MTNVIFFGDIVEENGKTIRENNMEKKHARKVGDRVTVKVDDRVLMTFICHLGRDCDGTPLYYTCGLAALKEVQWNPEVFHNVVWRISNGVEGGFSEESVQHGWGLFEDGGPF